MSELETSLLMGVDISLLKTEVVGQLACEVYARNRQNELAGKLAVDYFTGLPLSDGQMSAFIHSLRVTLEVVIHPQGQPQGPAIDVLIRTSWEVPRLRTRLLSTLLQPEERENISSALDWPEYQAQVVHTS